MESWTAFKYCQYLHVEGDVSWNNNECASEAIGRETLVCSWELFDSNAFTKHRVFIAKSQFNSKVIYIALPGMIVGWGFCCLMAIKSLGP